MSKNLFPRKQFTNSRTLSLESPFRLKVFLALSILTIFSFLALYIFQINKEISGKYLIQRQENELAELIEENKSLEINSVGMSSLDNVLGFLDESNLEKTDKIYYIRIVGNEVVTK